jgi:hypothetical protein
MSRAMEMTFWLPQTAVALTQVVGAARVTRPLAVWRYFTPKTVS